MFVIGETTGKVINKKLSLPKEYHLKKQGLLGKWLGEDKFYLSDSPKSLDYITGKETRSFQVRIDSEDRIEVPIEYENALVDIKGCISTVELTFHRR